MNFGSQETTKVLDDSGSTETTYENIVDKKVVRPVKKRYSYRARVHNQSEEQQAYYAFSDQLRDNPRFLDPAFSIEKNKSGMANGYYYVVSSYSVLEY